MKRGGDCQPSRRREALVDRWVAVVGSAIRERREGIRNGMVLRKRRVFRMRGRIMKVVCANGKGWIVGKARSRGIRRGSAGAALLV